MNESQTGVFGPQIAVPEALPGSQPGVRIPARRSVNALVLTLSGIIAVGVCGLTVTFGLILASLLGQVENEKAPIEVVLDHAMVAGKTRDAQALFALQSSAAHEAQPLSEIEKFLRGNGYVYFSGYRQLVVTDLTKFWSPVVYAEVVGSIEYDDGYTGGFEAVMVQEGGVWKIQNIQITVPLGKLDAVR